MVPAKETWVYNIKWVPDIEAGRRLFNMNQTAETDDEPLIRNHRLEPATDGPVDLAACRILAITAIIRRTTPDGLPSGVLYSLPDPAKTYDDEIAEDRMLSFFFRSYQKHLPTLITSNPLLQDLRPLIRRAVVKQIRIPGFDKILENYLAPEREARHTSCNLEHALGIDRDTTLSLPALARLSGIPGEPELPLRDLFNMWREGFIEGIVHRNEWEVLTYHLLWLRFAHFSGSLTAEEYEEEQELLREHLLKKARLPENSHLQIFLEQWAELNTSRFSRRNTRIS